MADNISQFFFAWCSSAETTFDETHQREDELIFSFSLTHDEGQFATLDLEIRNPHIGLLAPGRAFWAWFSWSDGTTVTPLFFGRLIGIPSDLFAEVITIQFVAKPSDYVEQRMALADTLKVLPFYDPIFIDPKKRDDPDIALEGYSRLYHVDRISHLVTTSDVIAGEDGVEEFTANDVFYDSVRLSIAGAPVMACEIEAQVDWVQCDHTGVIEFKTVPNVIGDSNIGNGLTVAAGLLKNTSTSDNSFPERPPDPDQKTVSWEYKNLSPGPHEDGDIMEESESISVPMYYGHITNHSESYTEADPESGQGEEYSVSTSYSHDHWWPSGDPTAQPEFPEESTDGPPEDAEPTANNDMQIAVEVEQNRTEVIHVRVVADVQPVLTEASEAEDDIVTNLSMDTVDVVAEGVLTASDGVYFPTARGMQSVEYLLMIARATLLSSSRVVETSWDCKFSRVVGLSCRKNATVEDSRLPGGIVLGKIVHYAMTGNGDAGEFVGSITINSAVGYGNPIETATGTPDYVNDGYVDLGYQHRTGQFVAATTNDMTFSPLAFEATGIQLPISADQVLIRHEFHDSGQREAVQALLATATPQLRQFTFSSIGQPTGSPSQELLLYAAAQTQLDAAIRQTIIDHPAWVEIELAPVQKISTSVDYDAGVGPLMVPMQIDLAAASTP